MAMLNLYMKYPARFVVDALDHEQSGQLNTRCMLAAYLEFQSS